MPAYHHSIFYRPDALPDAHPKKTWEDVAKKTVFSVLICLHVFYASEFAIISVSVTA